MSLIEGIGDEVTLFTTILVIATTLIAAWFSTRVRERPLPRVQVIQTTITSLRGQRTPGNVSATGDQSGRGGGTGGSDQTSDVTSASEVSQETDSTRTPENDSNAEQSSQITENATASDHRHVGAQSQEPPLSRTSESLETVSKEKKSDETDNKQVQSEESVDDDIDREQIDVEVLGETSSSSLGEPSSTHRDPEAGEESQNHDQNVLRNRQTGQTYPTLPAYSSEASQEASTSSGGTGDAGGVEDVASGRHSNEESGQTTDGRICIRVKFSNDEQRLVQTRPEETLGQFRRQNFVEEIEAGKLVRFIANGQFLADDTQTLSSLNLTNNSVLHCHVTQGEPIRQTQHRAQDNDLDLGHFMVPLFGCILGFVWYLRWQYRYMFNATSTLSLVGVTVLFVLAVLAAWRG